MRDVTSVIENIFGELIFGPNPSAEHAIDADGSIMLRIPPEGLAIRGSSKVAEAYLRHQLGVTLSESRALGTDDCLLSRLVHCRALVPITLSKILSKGLISRARDLSTSEKTELHEVSTKLALIGSAVDFSQVGLRSCHRGPDVIRSRLRTSQSLADIGNVAWQPTEGLCDYGRRLAYIAALCADLGAIPIVLGGDHSLTYFTVEALCAAGSEIGVIQFDAHNDLGDTHPSRSLDELNHANVAGYLRNLPIGFLIQAGIRSSQQRLALSRGCPLYQVTDGNISTFENVLKGALARHSVSKLYMSVDLDCVDPSEVPEVTTPLPGRMSSLDLRNCFLSALASAPLAGADFVEVTASDGENRAAAISAELIGLIG